MNQNREFVTDAVAIEINHGKSDSTTRLTGEARRMQDYTHNSGLYDENKKVAWSFIEILLISVSWIICLIIPFFWYFLWRTVRDYERALIFRLGKLKGGAEGPGVFFVNPLVDQIYVVDLRVETFSLPSQDMMTKDSVTVSVDAIAFMKVDSPIKCILEIENYRNAFQQFSATTLRSVLGQYDLEALLSARDVINERIRTIIEAETNSWGVTVPAVEIKDVKLPANMQRAMAAEAEAERERRAKIISAEGEAQAASQLAIAAEKIAEAPGALQLRYLHTLTKISAEKNSTILFPLPLELMRGIQQMGSVVNDPNQRLNMV